MLQEILTQRNLPNLPISSDVASWAQQRKEILSLLSREIYGVTPEFHGQVCSFIEAEESQALAEKATEQVIRLSFTTPNGLFSFPFLLLVPNHSAAPSPVFLHLAFPSHLRSGFFFRTPDEDVPREELIDHGYAIAELCYEDITSDTPAKDGLARAYPCETETSWGKIGMWAFAASRILDYLLTRKDLDSARIAVTGWSRLGKTALWCGAQDDRFSLVISTESGCSGAALHRGKRGEQIADITERFGFWFCGAYRKYAGKEDALPFDQHFLLSCIAPRALLIGSAEHDEWADPISEFLDAAAASEAYRIYGKKGLVSPDQYPAPDMPLLEGQIGYYLRKGAHAMSRSDWIAHLAYRKLHNI